MSYDPDTINIRRARPGDLASLQAMQAESFRALGRGYYSTAEIEAFLSEVGTMDEGLIEEGAYYVAVGLDGIVASGGWSRRPPDHADLFGVDSDDSTELTPRIRSVFVHPAYARRGLGRRLVIRSENEARAAGFGDVALTATLSGIPLYRKLGYETVRVFEAAMPGDALVTLAEMRKSIGQPLDTSGEISLGFAEGKRRWFIPAASPAAA